jgi:hypothetical protein
MQESASNTHPVACLPSSEDHSLPVVHAGGFGASLDAFAWEPDPSPETQRTLLWFVSMVGSQQALKAIWARLAKGELVTVSREALGQVRFCALAPQGPKGWRSYAARLPTSAGHQLALLPDVARSGAARDDFLLLPRSEDEAPTLHFRFLDRRLDVPLHASWSAWLWQRALRTGEAKPLEAEGILAYRCRPDPAALAPDVSAAIGDRQLRIPDAEEELERGTAR